SQFHALFDAVSRVMAQTPRSSSLVEDLSCVRQCVQKPWHPSQ
ncbi:MAG: hypothetical protein QOG73_830, partial [Acetobacteraceae bacterium]|nr:hypothetical protein [Acetobacteraceae bacterium]